MLAHSGSDKLLQRVSRWHKKTRFRETRLLRLALQDHRCVEPYQVSTLIRYTMVSLIIEVDPSAHLACGPTAPSIADMLTPDADKGAPHTQRVPYMMSMGIQASCPNIR